MWCDLAGDDELERPRLVPVVAHAVVDREIRRSNRPCGLQALVVEVDTDELSFNPTPARPSTDHAQDIPAAESDVEQPDASCRTEPASEERDRRHAVEVHRLTRA
jgi:hypothetical protein